MYRKVIAPVFAGALLALLVWLAYAVVKPFLVAIGWALMITVVTYPLYERLRRLLRGRSGLAATLMVVGIVLLLVAPTVGLIGSLSRQASEIYPKLEELAARGNPLEAIHGKLDAYGDTPVLGTLAGWVRELLPAPGELQTTLPEGMKKAIGFVTGLLTAALSNALLFLVNLFLTLAALGIFYLRGKTLAEEVTSLLPLPPESGRKLMDRLETVTKAVVKGVGLTCLAQGALGGLGFWAAGLPSPLLFGTVMAFASLVPVIGTWVVWVPGALFLLFTGKTFAGIGLALWGAIVVGNIDNVLRPILTGGDTGMPMPLLIVGMLGGAISFGLTGLILGPLVFAALLFVLEERRQAGSVEETPPPAAG
ncbi:MAG: AI-2E family transporter [Deltaproteobacteria bacterium]|nr:AI-2E family transporter [Deltaproteobacteria bacterium]